MINVTIPTGLPGAGGVTAAQPVVPIGANGEVLGGAPGNTPSKTRGSAQIAANVAAVPLLVANTSRKDGSFVTNDSVQTLYVRFAASNPTTSYYDVGVDGRAAGSAGGTIYVPDGYKGEIRGIWSGADAAGNANVIEFT